MDEIEEPARVQALVAHRSVDALDEGILDRPAGPDEVELDAVLIGPGIQGVTGELWTVVADDPHRERARLRQALEHANDALPRQGAVDCDGHGLAAGVVHDVEDADLPPRARLSPMKSMDQRSFGRAGSGGTTRVLAASCFRFRVRTARPSAR